MLKRHEARLAWCFLSLTRNGSIQFCPQSSYLCRGSKRSTILKLDWISFEKNKHRVQPSILSGVGAIAGSAIAPTPERIRRGRSQGNTRGSVCVCVVCLPARQIQLCPTRRRGIRPSSTCSVLMQGRLPTTAPPPPLHPPLAGLEPLCRQLFCPCHPSRRRRRCCPP